MIRNNRFSLGTTDLMIKHYSYWHQFWLSFLAHTIIHRLFPHQVVPDPEKPLSGFKFKCLYDKEQKGPVTEVDCIMGHIISAIGQKIYVWSFLNNDLVGVAFIDTQIYIHRWGSRGHVTIHFMLFTLYCYFIIYIYLLQLFLKTLEDSLLSCI